MPYWSKLFNKKGRNLLFKFAIRLKVDFENCSFINLRLYANRALHPFDKVFANRKAKPDAVLILVSVFIDFVEI